MMDECVELNTNKPINFKVTAKWKNGIRCELN